MGCRRQKRGKCEGWRGVLGNLLIPIGCIAYHGVLPQNAFLGIAVKSVWRQIPVGECVRGELSWRAVLGCSAQN
jgi:hypothetical protein